MVALWRKLISRFKILDQGNQENCNSRIERQLGLVQAKDYMVPMAHPHLITPRVSPSQGLSHIPLE